MNNTLVLDGVSLRLHGRPLVPPLSAQVSAGQVLAVMGPSGVGKSSLLAWVAGLLQPPLQGEGRIHLAGRELTALPVEQRRVGLMFQDDLLFPHLDVLGNLLFALPAGDREARHREALQALADAGLAGLDRRRPHELSGGQRSRVALLRTLLARPEAVLLDEPFSRLDAAMRGQLRHWVWTMLRQRGVPALLVTHDEADAPDDAQRLVLSAARQGDHA